MIGTIALIGLLIAMILRANKKYGKIKNKKINYTHIALMIITVLMTSTAVNAILKLVLQYETTIRTIYIQNGFFDPITNTTVWAISTFLNVLVLYLIMSVALRSNKARTILINILPIAFLINTIRSFNVTISASTPESSIGLTIGVAIIVTLLIFAPLFFFYRNKNVTNIIFNSVIQEKCSNNV